MTTEPLHPDVHFREEPSEPWTARELAWMLVAMGELVILAALLLRYFVR